MAQAKKKETNTKKLAEVKEESTAVVTSDFADDLLADAGMGMEQMTADDLQIPRIGIIQSLSPQRSKTKEQYIEGATEGQIFDNVKKELLDGEKGIRVVPISFSKSYLEWIPRDSGGGLAAVHEDASILKKCAVDGKGNYVLDSGNMIVPTAEYFLFVLDESGKASPAVVSMAKSAMKQSKNWNTLMNQLEVVVNGKPITPPMFYGVYTMKTVPMSNDQGEWFRWEIAADGNIESLENGRAIYQKAKDFLQSIADGAVKVADHEADVSSEVESDDDPM